MSVDYAILASQAVQFDSQGKHDAAVYLYGEAVRGILAAVQQGVVAENEQLQLKLKAKQYLDRAEELQRQVTTPPRKSLEKAESIDKCGEDRAEFLLKQAMGEDERGNVEEAVELYSQAIELCLEVCNGNNTSTQQRKARLRSLAKQALERAEELKGQKTEVISSPPAAQPKVPSGVDLLFAGDGDAAVAAGSASPRPKRIAAASPTTSAGGYSAEELAVLRTTSLINGREYVPFMSVDLRERFAFPVPFTDKCGMLALSEKQRSRFSRWARPDEFLDSPAIIKTVDPRQIRQTLISDCSFVASLAVSALYEKRFQKLIITTAIYPQNRNRQPVYNPCGKYMIKLHLNGVTRKIVIDDYLPIGKHGELLCSFSNDKEELWVSLLEKAYMKVMGGYDFPGSNSNIDLHALTGWIPERMTLRKNDDDFNAAALFDKLLQHHAAGNVLVTLATGKLSPADCERAGLVECHAYALLDVRAVKGKRLMLVKNPWNHVRWRGNYSELDSVNWTPEMQRLLAYDPKSAQQYDDGVFWIDYDSVLHFFEVVYMNWNPSLFSRTYAIHSAWSAGVGPSRDLYNIGENPQFCLEVNDCERSGAVWILLTRHITDKDDFAQNREYITVLVYKADGRRVYYPFDPPPFIDGTRINSSHYLCKMVLKKSPATQRYTLVVSQYEKSSTIRYTLRVYGSTDFKLTKLRSTWAHTERVNGEWKGKTAGGCANYPATVQNNPTYQLAMDAASTDEIELCAELRGPKEYSVGLVMVQVSSTRNRTFARCSSDPFRPGFCVLTAQHMPAGIYNIVPQTFKPGQEGPYILRIQATVPFRLTRL